MHHRLAESRAHFVAFSHTRALNVIEKEKGFYKCHEKTIDKLDLSAGPDRIKPRVDRAVTGLIGPVLHRHESGSCAQVFKTCLFKHLSSRRRER